MILSPERNPQGSNRRKWVMAQLFELSTDQVARLGPLFSKKRDVKRVDDRKVLCSIIHGTRRSLRWVCPGGRWSPQSPRQPLPPLVRRGCV